MPPLTGILYGTPCNGIFLYPSWGFWAIYLIKCLYLGRVHTTLFGTGNQKKLILNNCYLAYLPYKYLILSYEITLCIHSKNDYRTYYCHLAGHVQSSLAMINLGLRELTKKKIYKNTRYLSIKKKVETIVFDVTHFKHHMRRLTRLNTITNFNRINLVGNLPSFIYGKRKQEI